jgi:hypothetical protein
MTEEGFERPAAKRGGLPCLPGLCGREASQLGTRRRPQLYKPNRLSEPGRVMGESPGSHGILPGAPPAPARPRNISRAYAQRLRRGFPGSGPLWGLGQRRSALSGGQRTAGPAGHERFPRTGDSPGLVMSR